MTEIQTYLIITHHVSSFWLPSNVTKTYINIHSVLASKDRPRYLSRLVYECLGIFLTLLIPNYVIVKDNGLNFFSLTRDIQVFAVLLLALSYLALASKECSAFGNSCRHFLLFSIIGSCFMGYLLIFLSRTGYFTVTTNSKKRKCSSLKNPKKLTWCGSVHQTEQGPSHSHIIWSWYKAGFKQATIFITFGLALSPVLYKVSNYQSTDFRLPFLFKEI